MGTGGVEIIVATILQESDFIHHEKSFVSLLSTGLDSPIATYLIMKKGYSCFSLSFLNGLENGIKNKEKILKVGKKLVELTGQPMRLHFVDYDPIVTQFQAQITSKNTCIVCKRTMLMTAAEMANFYHSSMIVNGDILGEQASQTLDNLYVVHKSNLTVPVVRPLIGFDKLDIIKISQKVGFYDLSLIKGPACEYNPKYPETRAKLDEILRDEDKIDRPKIQKQISQVIEYVDLLPEN